MRYNHLLSPIMIGEHIIKNRLVYPNASPHFLQGPETFPAEGYRAFNANLAKNGAGIVTVAQWNDESQHIGPSEFDFTHMQSFHLSDPSVHNYIAQLADEIHFFNSKIIICLSLQFPEGYSPNGGRWQGVNDTKPFTADMVEDIVKLNVETANFYHLLGFDGMSIRCDHYMLNKGNERQDEFGGDIVKRTLLLRKVLAAIKEKFAGKFIIEGEVAWEQVDGYDGRIKKGTGYSEEDCLKFMELTEGIIDIMQIREHNICDAHPTGYSFKEGVHPNLEFCQRAKARGIKMLLEPIGGYQDPELMEEAIANGYCDMFGAARAFMADYEYGEKLREGRGEDIVPCLLCNRCHGTIFKEHDPWLSKCSVNPILDKTNRLYRLVEQTTPQKVGIIGGGPAGLRAALYTKERGHDVTIYEKSDQLGGQLFHADYFSFKWPLKKYRDWLIKQVEKANIKVITNCQPTRQELIDAHYDALIVAIGAIANKPAIKGNENALTCLEAIKQEKQLGQKVVIIGGSEVGMETAMFLCENNHDVTVLTRQDELGHNCSKLHYVTMNWLKENKDGIMEMAPAWEKYENLHGIIKATTTEIKKGEVCYLDSNGEEQSIKADDILISGGMKNLTSEAMNYAGITDKFFVIGDCSNQGGNLQNINYQAYSAAMNI